VMTLALGGRGTKSHMLLDSRASYSSIVQCQWGSVSALWTEVRAGDSVGGAAAVESCRQSIGLVTPAA
jgi:fructose-1,6-bisphosphatase